MRETVQVEVRRRVEMTMLEVRQAAYRRDLERLGAGDVTGWERFKLFLRLPQEADRTYLWPVVRDQGGLLARMDSERIGLTGLLDAVDATLSGPAARVEIGRLARALEAYGRDERALVRQAFGRLNSRERAEYLGEPRRLLGFRGAAAFYPWLLDGASGEQKRVVLAELAPTDRLLFRTVWRARYRV